MTAPDSSTRAAIRKVYAYAERQLASGASAQGLRDTLLSKGVPNEVVDSVLETLITEKPPLPVRTAKNKPGAGRFMALIRVLALTLSPLGVTLSHPFGSLLLLIGILGPELTLGKLPREWGLGVSRRASTAPQQRNSLLLKLSAVFAPMLFAARLETTVGYILNPLLLVVVYLSVFLLQTLGVVARQDANLLIFGGIEDDMIGVTSFRTFCLWPAVMLAFLGNLRWWERAAVCVSAIPTAILCNVFSIVVTALLMNGGSSIAESFSYSTPDTILSLAMACSISFLVIKACRLWVGHGAIVKSCVLRS